MSSASLSRGCGTFGHYIRVLARKKCLFPDQLFSPAALSWKGVSWRFIFLPPKNKIKKKAWLIEYVSLSGKRERQIVGQRGRLHFSLSGPAGPRRRARPPLPAAGPRLAAPAAALRPIRGLAHLASKDKTPELRGGGWVWEREGERKSHFYVSNDGGGRKGSTLSCLASLSVTTITLYLFFCESWLRADVLCRPNLWERTPERVQLPHHGGVEGGLGGEPGSTHLISCFKHKLLHDTHARTLLKGKISGFRRCTAKRHWWHSAGKL